MRTTYRVLAFGILLLMIVSACKISFSEELSQEEKMQTAVAQTVAAGQVMQPTVEVGQPTLTLSPTNTVSVPPTNTPQPCNKALYVSETVPDDTEYDVNESFTKTWRLKNIGTCTWNTNYKLVFASGEKMSGPSSQNLSVSVAPGEQADISVSLKAPGTAGTYKGIWNIVDDAGQTFVYNIWVQIKAMAILAPPPVAKADLTITEFNINPATPTMGENAHVRVRAHNQGTADSGGFIMNWHGLSTFPDPSCSWNIAGGLVAGGSVLMECDFIFGSWYPINKTSIVYIDVGDQEDESNEGNNTASISPFGVVAP